jgi:23S rRNA pseudouridine1911/1915/1917 synthase
LSSPGATDRQGFAAGPDDEGRRLDVVLAEHSGLSRAAAQRLLADGRVLAGGEAARKNHLVRAGEVIAWSSPPQPEQRLAPEHVPFTVVYEDDWLLVVDKPAGVVVHPAPGHEHGTLAQGLVAEGARGGHQSRPGIVHRLDKDTSGLLIVARRDEAYRELVAAMERRDIHRTYLALLAGDLPQEAGTIDAPIGRHLRDRKRMSLHTAAGRRAVTHFEVLGRTPGFTLARVVLETGRTHQIRVHFSALGYPVAGDVQYARPPRPEGLERQFLHSSRVVFPHPRDGREISCASPLPPDLSAFLERLGLPPQPRDR